MKSAVLYARVSSKDQEREGFSIPAQLKALREYAAKNGFTLCREFVDVETAKQAGRTEFGKMLAFIGNAQSKSILVEKTDRLYRNFHDLVKLEDLGAEIHLVKEGRILSRDSRSSDKLAHNLNVVLARHYIDNMKEEVAKGMREKAEQGIYPSRPPFGYRNNKADHTIEVDGANADIMRRCFELWATGEYSLATLKKQIRLETGKHFAKGHLHKLLKHPFYDGFFDWQGIRYKGNHERFIAPELFGAAQEVFERLNRPKYGKHNFAFAGIATCAEDGCAITAEVHKQKYVYYRCTGYKGRCRTPYMREDRIAERLGDVLQDIRVPESVAKRIVASIARDRSKIEVESIRKRSGLQQRLETLRKRMEQAYVDKLDGVIEQGQWSRMNSQWQAEESEILRQIANTQTRGADHALSVERILELANRAYLLYITQKPHEQAKLLKMVLSNCAIDGASAYPTYRKPFDIIAKRAKAKEWRARKDSNLRPTDS